MSKIIKQTNIFGSVDHINEDGDILRCEMCKKPLDTKVDVCSDDCAKSWVEKFIP